MERFLISVLDVVLDAAQAGDVFLQKTADAVFVGKAYTFPHFGRGGSDARNVAEAAGSKCFHIRMFVVIILYEVYEGRGGDVRNMTDGGCHIVVCVRVDDDAFGLCAGEK